MQKIPDMEQMIADAEAKRKDNEIMCFAIGAGRVAPKFGMKKKQEQALKMVQEQEGFIGYHLVDLWHTLLIFDTLNNAKYTAKNGLAIWLEDDYNRGKK